MHGLKFYVLRYWRRYFFGALCLLATVTLVMWIPWWIREAVRILEEGGALSDVTYYAALIGLAALAQGIDDARAYVHRLRHRGCTATEVPRASTRRSGSGRAVAGFYTTAVMVRSLTIRRRMR